MHKLLSANFSRLLKDRTFLLCIAAMLIYSFGFMLNACRQASILPEYNHSLDEYYFNFAVSIGLFCALFCSMFIGTEYSDGTIRNKIITGHIRINIYLTNFIITFTATLLIMSVWLIGALIAVPTLGIWKMEISNLILYLIIAIAFVAAFSSIFTFVGMQSANKAVTAIISILLFLGLLLFASIISNSLEEPKTINDIILTQNGIEMGEPVPNPNYVSGTKREIFEFIIDFLPTGQGLQMALVKISHPVRMILSSVFITIFTMLSGIILFNKKDLK